jgi:hypothetical protein
MDQTLISDERVDLATACAVHYGLHTGMVIQYLKVEYVRESRNTDSIIESASPHTSEKDCDHIMCIINQGCPSYLNFEEGRKNKNLALQKGNQHTFHQHPEVTAKTMNKEDSLSNSGSSISPHIVVRPPKEYKKSTASFGSSLTPQCRQSPTKSFSVTRPPPILKLRLILDEKK